MKSMKMPSIRAPKVLQPLLQNRIVLYVAYFIAFTNALAYLSVQNYRALAFFVLVGLVTSYFSKNMIVISIASVVLTNLVYAKNTIEGMTGKNEETADEEEEEEEKPEPKKETKGSKAKTTKKQGFTNKHSSEPASFDDDDEDVGDRIDYASTLEQAYDNLQNMIGKDGISSLTKDTEKLINQQKNLMGTLNEISPLINTAKETLSGLNMGDLNKSLGNLTEMMGSFNKK